MIERSPIVVQDLCKDYVSGPLRRTKVSALKGITFTVESGSLFALVGPNGAGKSTTMHLMLGFIPATSGSVRVLGHPPESHRSRESLGFLPEVFAYDRFVTGRRLLGGFDALAGGAASDRARRVEEVLELVALTDQADRKVGTYSKGMTQRIGLAQALLGDPELVILDEPMSGMDPASRRSVKDILMRRRARGRTTLLSSHILSDIEELADHVVILRHGTIVANAPMAALKAESGSMRVSFRWGEATSRPAEMANRAQASDTGPDAVLTIDCVKEELNSVLEKLVAVGASIEGVSERRQTLESLFLGLTESSSAGGEP
jgi:ABC-2 type transport system ATP-binding protein